jgi:ABC-type lipoprotein release transport system permease subunit
MSLYLRLAWRNLWRHRRRTVIVVLAIGLTLWMMMIYDGLMVGFQDAIYGNAIKVLGGNMQIYAEGYHDNPNQTPLLQLPDENKVLEAAQAQPQVVAASRRINTNGLASNREGAFGVSIVGIEPDKEQDETVIAQNVIAGKYLTPEAADVLLIGKGLAEEMGVTVGDRITLVGSSTHNQMRQRTMTIGGIFDLGMPDIEKRTVYMSLSEAENLYDMNGAASEVMVILKQIGQEGQVKQALQASVPGYVIDSWQTSFPDLESALSRKNLVMDIFSIIILLIAGIGILNLLLMAVYERTREIGLLGALGLKPRQISILFLLEGALMGVVGILFGVLLGLAFNAWLGRVGFDYSQFSSLTDYTALINGRVYSTLGLEKIVMRTVTVLVISTLAAFYPAYEAAKREPAEALHYV